MFVLIIGLDSGELLGGVAEPALGQDIGGRDGHDEGDCEGEEGPEVALGVWEALAILFGEAAEPGDKRRPYRMCSRSSY